MTGELDPAERDGIGGRPGSIKCARDRPRYTGGGGLVAAGLVPRGVVELLDAGFDEQIAE
jgi:hypothetical protein